MYFNIAKISNKKNLSPFLYYYFPFCAKINSFTDDSVILFFLQADLVPLFKNGSCFVLFVRKRVRIVK